MNLINMNSSKLNLSKMCLGEKNFGKMSLGKTKTNEMKLKTFKDLFVEEDGMGTVEVILIIVVLVGLVVIFRTQITSIVSGLFRKITDQTDTF